MIRNPLTLLLTAVLTVSPFAPGVSLAAEPSPPAPMAAQLGGAGTSSDHMMPSVAKLAAVPTLLTGTTAPPAATMQESFFGMHVLHLPTGTAWPTVKFGTWRLWDAGVDWRDLQPTANTYNWTTLDTYIALAQQQKIDVLLELGQTPAWASVRPNEAGAGGNGAAAPPTSNTLWTNYVTAVATRYKGKIAYYEIWNEADTTTYFSGTPTQLVQLTALASKAIKSIDPAAHIISPSLHNAGANPIIFLKSLLDLGMAPSVDAIGVHFYELGQSPEAILWYAQQVQALLKQYKLSTMPVLNTEFGWAAPTQFNTVDDQSGYMMRSMLMGWTGGISRFLWYAWDNSNWVTVTMTNPGFKTPTMVAKAYSTLQGWTVGKEVSPCVAATSVVWSCDITDMSGDHSRIYWNTAGSGSVTPSLTWTPAHLVDMYGNVSAYKGGALAISTHPVLITE